MDSYIKEIDDLLADLSAKMNEDKEWLWSFVYEDINEADSSAIEMYIRDVIKCWIVNLYKINNISIISYIHEINYAKYT